MSYDNPIIYRDDPTEDFEDAMEFRLTYEGKLASTRSSADKGYILNKVQHKHEIRRHFHKQLKLLWTLHPVTKHMIEYRDRDDEASFLETICITENNFRWLPLITEKMAWECDIHVLYLRNGARGSVLNESDIDNRIKTLLDALKMPKRGEIHKDESPTEDEKPFYVLFDDDKVISRLSVETDTLLSPTGVDDQIDSRLVIKVKAKPYYATDMWEIVQSHEENYQRLKLFSS